MGKNGYDRYCAELSKSPRSVAETRLQKAARIPPEAVKGSAGRIPLPHWRCPFIVRFRDLSLVLERGDFVGGETGVLRDGFHSHTVGFHLPG